MTITVPSRNGVLVRLTDERWAHIAEEHCELAGCRDLVLEAVSAPQRVLAGGAGELLAVREFEAGKFLVVVYRELENDGCHHGVLDAPGGGPEPEKTTMAVTDVQEFLKLVPVVKAAPQHSVWLSYDAEADTLYINFKRPSHATDSELTDNDVIVRYAGEEIVGFTVLHASQRSCGKSGA